MAESIERLLTAAANLKDVELAVALQGLLARRPAARAALFTVWQAEEGVSARLGPQAAPPQVTSGLSPLSTPPAGVPLLTEPKLGAAEAEPACSAGAASSAGELMLAEARAYAARAGARSVGSDHVLAAAVHGLPEQSVEQFGAPLDAQLRELLEKSSLRPKESGVAVAGGEGLPCRASIQPLLSALNTGGPTALFHALKELPDAAAASQLLEMARIFQARGAAQAEASVRAAEAAAPVSGSKGRAQVPNPIGAPAPPGTAGGPSRGGLAIARRYAAQAGGREVGTDHVMAAALEAFPSAAEQAFGGAFLKELLGLLEKSRLAPPPPNGPVGEGLAPEEEAKKLLELWATGPAASVFAALQELPDSASATQLLEIAKVFQERGT